MKRKIIISSIFVFLLFFLSCKDIQKLENKKCVLDSFAFSDYKFGIFIHWSLASGYGRTIFIPDNKLLNIAKNFDENAYLFDADEWCRIIKLSGAKYIVTIAKHEDGFCLWPTDTTKFSAKRDYLGELVDSAKKYELDIFFYYAWELRKRGGQEFSDCNNDDLQGLRIKQLKELVTIYNPKGIWIDNFAYPYKYFEKIVYQLKSIKPSLLIGEKNPQYAIDRLSDYLTCENQINYYCAKELHRLGLSYEVCSRLPEDGENIQPGWFGYDKPVSRISISKIKIKELSKKYIDKLIHNNGIGANFLLNITPTSNGSINAIQEKILYGIGKWINDHSVFFLSSPTMNRIQYGYEFVDDKSNNYLYLISFQENGLPLFKSRSIYINQLKKKFDFPLSYYNNPVLSPNTPMIFFHKKGVAKKIILKKKNVNSINKYSNSEIINYNENKGYICIESNILQNGDIIKINIDEQCQ